MPVVNVGGIIECALELARKAQLYAFNMGANWLIGTELELNLETMQLTLTTRPVVLEPLF
jgi:hypothetical protein